MANTSTALEIVRTYHASWTSKDFVTATSLLAPTIRIEVPINHYRDKESFASALSMFGEMVRQTRLLGEFESGDQAMLLYDLEVAGLGALRVAEHFVVEGQLIAKIRQVHDTHAVRKAGFGPTGAKAIADTAAGSLLATIDLVVPPDRAFRALASPEITTWWVRPGVFDAREWTGDVRKGGRWRASGIARGRTYTLEGEFLAVEAPHSLVHTWSAGGASESPSRCTYTLVPTESGTRVTLTHSGLGSPEQCANTATGWETSFDQLASILALEVGA